MLPDHLRPQTGFSATHSLSRPMTLSLLALTTLQSCSARKSHICVDLRPQDKHGAHLTQGPAWGPPSELHHTGALTEAPFSEGTVQETEAQGRRPDRSFCSSESAFACHRDVETIQRDSREEFFVNSVVLCTPGTGPPERPGCCWSQCKRSPPAGGGSPGPRGSA